MQSSSCSLCHSLLSLPPSLPPRDVTQHISTHHEFQGADSFCSESSVVESHLVESFAYLLYTSICYTGPIKCVSMQKHPRRHTHTHTHVTRKTARQLSVAVPVTLVSEVSRERAEVCVCVSFVYMCVDVCRCKGGGRLSIVLQISWQSTSSWPAGDTRGLSGRCELLLPLHVAFVKKNKQNWAFKRRRRRAGRFWIVTLRRTWTHNDAAFRNETGSHCRPLTRRVESGILDSTVMAVRGGVELNFWLSFVECYAAVGPSLFSLSRFFPSVFESIDSCASKNSGANLLVRQRRQFSWRKS